MATLKHRNIDKCRHKACGKAAFFECIENDLYKQKQELETVKELLDKLYGAEGDVAQTIGALEDLNLTLSTMAKLIQQRGASAKKSRCAAMRALKKMFETKKSKAAAALDNTPGELKANSKTTLKLRPFLLLYHAISPTVSHGCEPQS
jgi:hypothetical protein